MNDFVNNQIRFIYNSISELKANAKRTSLQEYRRIAGTTSRCYVLIDTCEALEKCELITHEYYMEVWGLCSKALNQLTVENNRVLAQLKEQGVKYE